MRQILGREVLTAGLVSYLHSLSYSGAVEEDLFAELETAGREAGV